MQCKEIVCQGSVEVSSLAYGDQHHKVVDAAGGDSVLSAAIAAAIAPVMTRLWPAGVVVDLEIFPHLV